MFFLTPSSKEQTMKRIATTLVIAVVASLAFSSIASAHRGVRSHANVAPGPCAHAASKAAQSRLQSRTAAHAASKLQSRTAAHAASKPQSRAAAHAASKLQYRASRVSHHAAY